VYGELERAKKHHANYRFDSETKSFLSCIVDMLKDSVY